MYKYKWVWLKNRATSPATAHYRPMSGYEEICIFTEGATAHSTEENQSPYHPQGLRKLAHPLVKKKRRKGVYGVFRSSSIQPQRYKGYPKDILKFDCVPNNRALHVNEKPVALLEYLLKTYSSEGETVLDMFMGSASTGEACLNTNRNFIGFEKDPEIFKVAEGRLNKVKKTLSNG